MATLMIVVVALVCFVSYMVMGAGIVIVAVKAPEEWKGSFLSTFPGFLVLCLLWPLVLLFALHKISRGMNK